MLIAAGASAADVDKVYIVPFDSDLQHADSIAMTAQADGSFTAQAVELDFGFQFYAISAGGTTLYSLPSWAVSPAVEVLPNPLAITTADSPIQLEAGVYDVSFFTKQQTGHTYKLFTVKAVEAERVYPTRIFLIYGTGAGQSEELTGDGTGIYHGVLTTSSPFRISYEPRTGVYVFGPQSQSSTDLAEGVKTRIEYGVGTNATLSYSDPERVNPEITISLVDGDSYVLIGDDVEPTGLAMPELPDNESLRSIYYTIGGTPVATVEKGITPDVAPGIYIVRTGSKVIKRAITQ